MIILALLLFFCSASAAYCDCPCLNTTTTCDGLALSCANGGYFDTNISSQICSMQDYGCPVEQLVPNWYPPYECTCPPGYTGPECKTYTTNHCGTQQFDDTFRPARVGSKTIYCEVDYLEKNLFINQLLYLVHHRVEIEIINSTDMLLDIYSRVVHGDDVTCGETTKIISCKASGCDYTESETTARYKNCDSNMICELCSIGGCARYNVFSGINSFSLDFTSITGGEVTIGMDAFPSIILPLTCQTGICQEPAELQYFESGAESLNSVTSIVATSTTLAICLIICIFGTIICRKPTSWKDKVKEQTSKSKTVQGEEGIGPNIDEEKQQSIESEFGIINLHPAPNEIEMTENKQQNSSNDIYQSNKDHHNNHNNNHSNGITFIDINLNIKNKQILNNISGYCQNGNLMAIMGPSGSGKTTLLNILAGKHKTHTSTYLYCEHYGYVNQSEYLLSTQTVYEALYFSARLRGDINIDNDDIHNVVIDVANQLGILSMLEQRIGDSINGGLSGGERRRVSIGLELVCGHQSLLLDEPTTGLDSYNALKIVQLLRNLSDNNNIPIILTIHQCPSDTLKYFDQMLYLARNHTKLNSCGKSMYFGSPLSLINYLNMIKRPIPEFHNPAEHMLTLAMTYDGDILANEFIQSDDYKELYNRLLLIKEGGNNNKNSNNQNNQNNNNVLISTAPPIPLINVIKSTILSFHMLITREIIMTTREPGNLITHNIAFGLIGLAFALIAQDMPLTLEGMQSRLGSLFWFTIFFAFTSISSTGVFVLDRNRFYMEVSKGYYSKNIYAITKVVSELFLLRLLPPVLFSIFSYFLMGLQDNNSKFGIFVLVLTLVNITAASFALLVSSWSNTFAQANFITMIFLIFFMIFSGLFLNIGSSTLITFFSNISFLRFGYEALLINEFDGIMINFAPVGAPSLDLDGSIVINNVGMDIDAMYRDIWCLVGFFIGFTLLTLLTVRFRKHT